LIKHDIADQMSKADISWKKCIYLATGVE
jgi:hypothetical protein